MIPYFEQPSFDLGPLTIHTFGALVAAGILAAFVLITRRCARVGLDVLVAGQLMSWILVGGFLGAHLVDRFLYNVHETLADPLSLFRIWEGISSYGGVIGGIAGAWLFFRKHPQGARTWQYLDAIAYGMPVGWFLGRLGCFVAYDHVGTPTEFFLGQTYLDGVVRHNLGFEEALFWGSLTVVMAILGRRPRPAGFLLGVLAVLYAPVRFGLDFFRIADERYAGLIVSQYASIVLLGAGVWVLWYSLSSRRRRTPPSLTTAAVE